MRRSILPMTVAILSTVIHQTLTIITISGIVDELHRHRGVRHSGGVYLILLLIALVVEITALVASISLIYGVYKKRTLFISAWLFVTCAYMILNVADFVGGFNALGYLFPIKIAVAVLQIVFLLCIFKYLHYLRAKNNTKQEEKRENAHVEASLYPQLGEVDNHHTVQQ